MRGTRWPRDGAPRATSQSRALPVVFAERLAPAVLGVLADLAVRWRELLFQPLRGAIQPLAQVVTQLMAGLGSEEQGQGAPDQRAERKRSDHGEGGLVGIALLQADPVEQIIPFRESGPKLLGKVLERHRSSSIGRMHRGRPRSGNC